jgi:hypothetical protein
MCVSQSLLAMPALLLIQALLILEWRLGRADGAAVAAFVVLTLLGCLVFYILVRFSLSERLSREPSLSAPQMVYALAGPARTAVLCLIDQRQLRPPGRRSCAAGIRTCGRARAAGRRRRGALGRRGVPVRAARRR